MYTVLQTTIIGLMGGEHKVLRAQGRIVQVERVFPQCRP